MVVVHWCHVWACGGFCGEMAEMEMEMMAMDGSMRQTVGIYGSNSTRSKLGKKGSYYEE